MIIFDLEWNGGVQDGIPLNEILQIGAVRLERIGGQILDSFCAYIRPCVHKEYSSAAAKLPDISLYEASELDFPSVWVDFIHWCAGDQLLGTWGSSDLYVLRQNVRYWKLPFDFPWGFYDIQEAFGHILGTDASIALYRAIEYCHIPQTFEFHNSLHDALYTALLAEYISPSMLQQFFHIPHISLRQMQGITLGNFGSFFKREQMLNNLKCRTAKCPYCDYHRIVYQWHQSSTGQYLTRFFCRQHGDFFLALSVGQDHRSRYHATTWVLPVSEDSEELFRTAQENPIFYCRDFNQNHRKKSRYKWQ